MLTPSTRGRSSTSLETQTTNQEVTEHFQLRNTKASRAARTASVADLAENPIVVLSVQQKMRNAANGSASGSGAPCAKPLSLLSPLKTMLPGGDNIRLQVAVTLESNTIPGSSGDQLQD